ncbi:MAG: HlyD family efflux transporter periplasmic adaptor subunit [Oceanospirillaceae bacterium]|nr:HlyD family efflux transporter periplasmic adaptor subunit [Oceanospirillaceae bacterium]
MTVQVPGPAERLFAQILSLQSRARAAKDADSLAYALVNDAQPLFGYRHAALVIAGRVRAVTGISQVEPHAPFVAFVENAVRQWLACEPAKASGRVDPEALDPDIRADWQDLSAAEVFWLPFLDRRQLPIGGLWIARDQPWTEPERALLNELGDCYSHAWQALQPRRGWRLRDRRWTLPALAALALLLLLVPVRQSVLAPAEVIPLNGQVVTAPLDGVIAGFEVKPNQSVRRGDTLLRFDSTSLQARAAVAERSLDVAQAELRSNTQRAFSDVEAKSRLDLLAARVEQKRAERDYALELLARSELRADRDGIAVFADADRLTGKPVQTGERLLEIAAPDQAQLRIDLAVGDAIELAPGTEIALFLDSDPLTRHGARLERLAYEAERTPAGQLAYRLDASFAAAPPRIGLRGTAKLYGERVPLALYLLRRPLSALRQGLGI